MILPFVPDPGAPYTELCSRCFQADVVPESRDGAPYFRCRRCDALEPRVVAIDPKVVSWVEPVTGEYWHSSVGIFLLDNRDRALVFTRTLFPFAMTIPAGHLDRGESPRHAVVRELREETGLEIERPSLFAVEDVHGDSCRRGSDHHHWHLFTGRLAKVPEQITIHEEGRDAEWLGFEELLERDLVLPVRHFLEKFGHALFEPRAEFDARAAAVTV